MFVSPADTVTTRYLQKARRSAERKIKTVNKSESICDRQADPPQDLNATEEERPFRRRPCDTVGSLCDYALSKSWNMPQLRRIWSFGYNTESIANIICNLPTSVQSSVEQVSSSWEKLIQKTGSNTLILEFEGLKDQAELSRSENQSMLDMLHPLESNNRAQYALLTMNFDAATQMRIGFRSNQNMAEILGLHTEEFDARLASHDLALPSTDLDCIRIFLHLLLEDLPIPGSPCIRYLRLASGAGGHKHFMLVCWCSLALHDIHGNVVEVRHTAIG
jgi:hypothetical protein